jgi:hypothetical protein
MHLCLPQKTGDIYWWTGFCGRAPCKEIIEDLITKLIWAHLKTLAVDELPLINEPEHIALINGIDGVLCYQT